MSVGFTVYYIVYIYIFVDDDTGDPTSAPMDVYALMFFSLYVIGKKYISLYVCISDGGGRRSRFYDVYGTIMATRKTRDAWDTREKFAFRPARPVSPASIHC